MAARRSFRVLALLELDQGSQADPAASRYFRRNFSVNALDLTFFSLGESFANLRTIIPVFASTLTASPFLIGLIPILGEIGWSLPQIFLSRFSARLQRKLPYVQIVGLLERIPYFFMAWLALRVNVLSANTALGLLVLLVILRSLGAGFVGLPWQEMIADIIPPGRRGSFFGTGFLLGQLAGILGSGLLTFLLASLVYPKGYAVSFFAAFAAMMISWGFMSLTREPELPAHSGELASGQQYGARGALNLLRNNRNFRRYMLSRGLHAFGFMAVAYMAVYALERFSLPQEYAAVFNGVMLVGAIAGNMVGAWLSDRRGSRAALLFATSAWTGALLTALAAGAWELFLVVFFLLGMSSSANLVGDLSLAMDFSTGPDRPVYIGTARTVTGILTIPTPFLAGFLIQAGGYSLMFSAAAIFSLVSMLVLWRAVLEPRSSSSAVLPEA